MRLAKFLLFALLAVPFAAAAPKHDAVLEFTAPAQLVGSVDFDGLQWAILVFEGRSGATFDVGLEGVWAAENHTAVSASRDEFLMIGNTSTTPPPQSLDLRPGTRFDAKLGWTGLGSLVVIADSISLSMDARAELRPPQPNATMADYASPAGFPQDTVRHWDDEHPVSTSDVVAIPNDIGTRAARLQAEGVRLLEWFNADIQCNDDCLPGGGPSHLATAKPARLDLLSYITVQSSDGTLNGTAQLRAAAFGGPSLAAHTDGYARFANANLTGRCGAHSCPNPDGEAFRANGTLQLGDIRLLDEGQGRMQATFAGQIEAASFGEAPVFGFSSSVAVWTAAGIITFLALAKGLAALFTRHRRPALDNPRTRHIYELICGQPGMSFSDLRKVAETGTGNLLRHLKKLSDEGLVVARPYRNSQRYYENHGRYDKDWQQFAVLKDDDNRMLHDWLLARPGSTQTQVLAGTARGRSPSALRHALKGLKAAGLITEQREGRFVYYRAVPLDAAKAWTNPPGLVAEG